MSKRASIFIGSSKEAVDIANAVFAELEDECDPTVWDQDLFKPSSYTLESLEGLVPSADYAVLILSPEDLQTSRGKIRPSPRDNVIFELGFFIGALSRKKVFVIMPKDGDIKIPSDFHGMTFLTYLSRKDNPRASVRTACIRIKSTIQADSQKILDRRSLWPLRVAIISGDSDGIGRLTAELTKYASILAVTAYDDLEHAREAMKQGAISAAFVDPFSLNGGIEMIAYARDRHREIGFALFGTRQELFQLPGVTGLWRNNLWHFWSLAKDSEDPSFAITVEDIVLMFFFYSLTGGAFGERPGRLALRIMRPEVAGIWPIWEK